MQHIISKDGTRIAYVTVGDGPPVVLVGGALNDHRGRASGLPLAEHLRTRFTVYAYDRRGRGESSDTAPYSVAREIEDLAALVDAAGGAAHVYGMSSGAMLALEAAAVGVPIRTLALYEPPYMLEGEGPRVGDGYRARLAAAVAEGRPGDAVELFMTEAVQMPPQAVAHMKGSPFWPHLAAFGPSLLHDAAITANPALPAREHLAKVRARVVVFAGGASPSWFHASLRALVERLPDATYRELAGQTHDVDPALLGTELLAAFA